MTLPNRIASVFLPLVAFAPFAEAGPLRSLYFVAHVEATADAEIGRFELGDAVRGVITFDEADFSYALASEERDWNDRFFAGGFSTLRGFDFRGASPVSFGGESPPPTVDWVLDYRVNTAKLLWFESSTLEGQARAPLADLSALLSVSITSPTRPAIPTTYYPFDIDGIVSGRLLVSSTDEADSGDSVSLRLLAIGPIPEPASFTLLLFGALAAGTRRR